MRLSRTFAPTRRDLAHDEASTNARLLLRAGYVDKLMAGVYSLLPLGLTVHRRLEAIIRSSMDSLGAQELRLPALQPRSAWEPTGRWAGLAPIMYQFRDHSDRDVGLGTTHEEIITDIVRRSIGSYRDLPLALYQIQSKFRDEPRPKSGLIRLREFVMKDLYSFHRDPRDLETFYARVRDAYLAIFRRCGLDPLVVEASGGDFSKTASHEFQVLTQAGEDHVLYCPACRYAQNREIATVTAGDPCPNRDGTIQAVTGVEVGNIFKLGTRFSEAIGARFVDEAGARRPLLMASYGIGLERLLATIAEVHHDERGLAWPASVAPALAAVIGIGTAGQTRARAFARDGEQRGLSLLHFDVDRRPGELFALADLLGLPVRIVFSEQTGAKCEWKLRRGKAEPVTTTAARSRLAKLG